MTQRHKHADVIIAWANGAKIQFRRNPKDEWEDSFLDRPAWHLSHEYRVKPEPKPDHCMVAFVYASDVRVCTATQMPAKLPSYGGNVKFTFDGETGALISVEILK